MISFEIACDLSTQNVNSKVRQQDKHTRLCTCTCACTALCILNKFIGCWHKSIDETFSSVGVA